MARPLIACAVLLLVTGCSRGSSQPGEPVAGIYAVKGTASVERGDAKKPLVRRAQAGVLLSSNMVLVAEKGGVVLEAFDGSFIYVPSGRHSAKSLKIAAVPLEGATRSIVSVTTKAERKQIPVPVVMARYEPAQTGKEFKDAEEAEFGNDVSFFFLPHKDKEEVEEKPPTPPPWMTANLFVHPLRRPLKPGDGARALVEAKGAVIVEFADQATEFADKLKLPLDLADVKRVVVADGSAKLDLPGGTVDLASGDIAEIAPLKN